MPQEAIDKINEAAAVAAKVVADAAAEAKAVINQAAASALQTLTTTAAVQGRDIKYILDALDKMDKKLDDLENRYVTQDQFAPVRNLVYGAAATLGLAILGAVAKLIFIK